MMRAKNNRSPYSLPFAVAAITILLALNFAVLPANASSLWVEVHPPVLEKADLGIKLIHFIDADTGWAETKDRVAEVHGRSGSAKKLSCTPPMGVRVGNPRRRLTTPSLSDALCIPDSGLAIAKPPRRKAYSTTLSCIILPMAD